MFLLYNTIGAGFTTLLLAVSFLVMAILFSIKGEYYEKYLSFVNPVLSRAYSDKGQEFIRKNRRNNVICYYLLAVVMGLNAYTQIKVMAATNTQTMFNWRDFWPFWVVLLISIFLMNHISVLITKKSKTADELLTWNILAGVVLAIILLGTMSIFIARSIF